MICINWDCETELTGYELARITNRLNKFRFCIRCRRFQDRRVKTIVCQECKGMMCHSGCKMYCEKCTRDRDLKCKREYQERRKNELV